MRAWRAAGRKVQPRIGPIAFKVGALSQSIAAGSSLGPVLFRWPRPLFVTGMVLVPRSGDRADMAGLRINIVDETQQQIFLSGDNSNNYMNALGATGLVTLDPTFEDLIKVGPLALQRPVAAGDQWFITIQNGGSNAVIPELSFCFEEGVQAA